MKIRGIYKITNKINGKVYIGESLDIYNRWKKHIIDLKNNSHHSYKLQKDWNIYGKNNFKFEIELDITNDYIKNGILETVLLVYESIYINKYNSIKEGYNIENTLEEVLKGKKDLNIVQNFNKKKSYEYIVKGIIDKIEKEGRYTSKKRKLKIKNTIKNDKKSKIKEKKIKNDTKQIKNKKNQKPKICNVDIINIFINEKFDYIVDNYKYFNDYIRLYDFLKEIGIKSRCLYKLLIEKQIMNNNKQIIKEINGLKSVKRTKVSNKGDEYTYYVPYINYEAINFIKKLIKENYKNYEGLICIKFAKNQIK